MAMNSINTNNGALAALASLNQTAAALQNTENQISTGKKVSSASDNPAIYAISQTMNAQISSLSAVQDGLTLAGQAVNTASSAAGSISSVLSSLANTVTSASSSDANLTSLQQNVTAALSEITAAAQTATFNGVNLLVGANGTPSGTTGTLSVAQDINGTQYSVTDALTQLNPASPATNILSALGLSGLDVTNSATNGGVNFSFANNLTASSFANNTTLTLGNGTNSWVFNVINGPAGAADTTTVNGSTQTINVIVNNSTQSVDQMVGQLASAISGAGFAVQTQSDGSLNIVGNGITAAASSSSITGVNTPTQLTAAQTNITAVQTAVSRMDQVSAYFGAASNQLTQMGNFASSLSTALTSGVGALTDADMAAESAQLNSLQTKQQLAIQSLSIANSQPQSLLTLFR